ncbi:MAG: TRAP transporter substrate-binding protein DctP [Proteobacteria bacterium]|nr:TRAP transporter substrate-binding protein DctP [Pseudomonadota bacterium]
MKRTIIIVAVVVLALIACPMLAQAEKTITLRMAHFIFEKPESAGAYTDKFFASEVAKRTGGKVNVEIFWSGQLGQTKELLGLVRSGTVDMAAFPAGYFPSQFPLWRGPNSLPFVMTKVDQVIETARRLPKEVPALEQEMQRNNVKSLFSHAIAPYQLFAKKPITKVENFKGLRCRTWGVYLPEALAAVGATGVSVFPTEAYEASKRGVVDAQVWGLPHGAMLKMDEVAPEISLWNIMAIVGWGIHINLDKWKTLPPDVQKVMLDVANECYEVEREREKKNMLWGRDVLSKKGCKFHEISQATREEWVKACPDFMESWVQANEKAGNGPAAKQMRDIWLSIVKAN